MRRISVTEGDAIDFGAELDDAIRRRLVRLEAEMLPTISFLDTAASRLIIRNLVGSVQVDNDLVLDIRPKVEGGNWQAALIDLMVDERVAFEGFSETAEARPQWVLPDVFAAIYADQLERAVRREGPLTELVRISAVETMLRGRLDVTRWTRHNLTRPHVFPQVRTILSVDNPFTAAMGWVAEALAARASQPSLARQLRSTAQRLRPGLPAHMTVDPGVTFRQIPPQWRIYEPAWATARAVLNRISPIHRSGVLEGLNLAIEPWPLLETLLIRALRTAALLGEAESWRLEATGHTSHLLLSRELTLPMSPLSRLQLTDVTVEPDGALSSNGRVVATFEAKYTAPHRGNIRQHFFQAISTAAAAKSPLSIIVYPERADPVCWETHGVEHPRRVIAVGLDMYNYRRGKGDAQRGRLLLDLVRLYGSPGK